MSRPQQRPDHCADKLIALFKVEDGINARQSAHSRSTYHTHQNSFCLVIEGVPGGNFVEWPCSLRRLSEQSPEEGVAQFPCSGLHAATRQSSSRGRVSAGYEVLQLQVPSQVCHETFVGFRLRPPQLVIEMNYRQHNTNLV